VWWSSLHLLLLALLAVALPAGSLLFGSGEFAWTMFSKSETYRLALTGIAPSGARMQLDPRSLASLLNAEAAHFLPAPAQWRHDPMAVTFRTGLPYIAALACRLGPYQSIDASLEERVHLDAPPVATRVRARCNR
jgi:hypothetical protein